LKIDLYPKKWTVPGGDDLKEAATKHQQFTAKQNEHLQKYLQSTPKIKKRV